MDTRNGAPPKVAQLMHQNDAANTSSDASQVSNAVIGTSQVKY